MVDEGSEFRSGFVGIIGRPNVGKSTLLNRIARQKVAITSDKPQTTRNRIRAVVTTPDSQLVFVDTPGFHKPHDALGERLNSMVLGTMRDVDAIVFLLDGAQTIGKGDLFIAGELGKVDTPVVGVVNKIDLLDGEKVHSQLEVARHLYNFAEVLAVSSKQGHNVPALEEALGRFMPPGPRYFPEDMVSDQPERTLVAELIREKALELTRDEVPHSVAVLIEGIAPRPGADLIDIEAVIYVERESQKGIIVGKGGRMIKEIGSRARREIEPLLGNQVFLSLRAKVEKDWSRNPEFIRRLDYS
ncbi:MAG: GTPase Era [Actinobacteria bacterium]|nr:GTPase Era [Actinomycetota bacterium]MBU1943691.1 GTPase Era [Actinomycetota bacterium]MBU2686165.1 GTPase Era [Actinomycetota bacterium]